VNRGPVEQKLAFAQRALLQRVLFPPEIKRGHYLVGEDQEPKTSFVE